MKYWLRRLLRKWFIKYPDDNRNIDIILDCPLCESSNEWPFPKERRNSLGFHFRSGIHWKPEKGHKDYELHCKLNYHYY